jgi:hypothetical protein
MVAKSKGEPTTKTQRHGENSQRNMGEEQSQKINSQIQHGEQRYKVQRERRELNHD